MAAGVVPSLFVNGAEVFLEACRAVTHFGALRTGPSPFERVEVNVQTQLILCGLPQAAVGAAEVFDAVVSQHVDLQLLLVLEPQGAPGNLAGKWQLYVGAMRQSVMRQTCLILERLSAVLAHVSFKRLPDLMSLALMSLEGALVTVHLFAALLIAHKPHPHLRVLQFVLPKALVSVERFFTSRLGAVVQTVAIMFSFVGGKSFLIREFLEADVTLIGGNLTRFYRILKGTIVSKSEKYSLKLSTLTLSL